MQRMRETMGRLGLTVNEHKTKLSIMNVSSGESFDFLGYTFGRQYRRDALPYIGMRPSQTATSNILRRIRDETSPTWAPVSVQIRVEVINRIVRGCGYIYDEEGIDRDKLAFVMDLKNVRRGRIKEYAEKYSGALYTEADPNAVHNGIWDHKADCAFPSATQNEVNEKDAANLLKNGVYLVSEGANMPTVVEGVNQFIDAGILYGPGKAANAGGVATSGLEMSQNSLRMSWTREEVDAKLHGIMKSIHTAAKETADEYGTPGNYVNGANIAGFIKVADSMLDQGVV